jgi:hypothetical protein
MICASDGAAAGSYAVPGGFLAATFDGVNTNDGTVSRR